MIVSLLWACFQLLNLYYFFRVIILISSTHVFLWGIFLPLFHITDLLFTPFSLLACSCFSSCAAVLVVVSNIFAFEGLGIKPSSRPWYQVDSTRDLSDLFFTAFYWPVFSAQRPFSRCTAWTGSVLPSDWHLFIRCRFFSTIDLAFSNIDYWATG